MTEISNKPANKETNNDPFYIYRYYPPTLKVRIGNVTVTYCWIEFTWIGIAQLSTCNHGIIFSPLVITDTAPVTVDTDLYTAFSFPATIYYSDDVLYTVCKWRDCCVVLVCVCVCVCVYVTVC